MAIESYQWIPGRGPSSVAIERMLKHWPRPAKPMGEAWFMSEKRTLYLDLVEKPIAQIEASYLENVLWEIASGTKCFGHLQEWDQWFRFLLPHLVLRCPEAEGFDNLLEITITTFHNIFSLDIAEEYQGYRDDVIQTLSLCLMKEELWIDWVDELTKQQIKRPLFLIQGAENLRAPGDWNCRQSDQLFSAMMFFCLRFLTPTEITSWVKSLVAIGDPFWRGHLLVWLVGFSDLLKAEIITPAKIERAVPKIDWHDSFLVNWEYTMRSWIPKANVQTFLAGICREIGAETLFQWIDTFARFSELKNTMWDIPDLYFDRFCNAD